MTRPSEAEVFSTPNQTPLPPCPVCGETLVIRYSGPLPGCPQGISTAVCPTDPTHNFGGAQTESAPAEVKPIAELVAQAARVCEARGHGGLWPCKENCIVCGLAEALESQAERIAELEASLAAIGSDTVEGKRIEESENEND